MNTTNLNRTALPDSFRNSSFQSCPKSGSAVFNSNALAQCRKIEPMFLRVEAVHNLSKSREVRTVPVISERAIGEPIINLREYGGSAGNKLENVISLCLWKVDTTKMSRVEGNMVVLKCKIVTELKSLLNSTLQVSNPAIPYLKISRDYQFPVQ